MKKLEKIVCQVKCGRLEASRAAFEVIRIVQCNRGYFNLQFWPDEDFEDFIFREFSHIVRMIESFDPQKANFCTFFYKSLQVSSACYRRRRATSQAEEESLDCMKGLLSEEQAYRYAQNEGELSVESSCAEETLRRRMDRLHREKQPLLMNKMRRRHYHSPRDEQIEDLRRTACLVLFLKSSAVADDSSVRNTSIVTGISEDTLFAMMEELKEKVAKKIARRQMVGRARDEAFFLQRKYRAQASKLDCDGSLCQSARQGYRLQSSRWRRNNGRLAHELNVAPSNRDIGELLNVSERKVSYILKLARRKIDVLRLAEEDE